MAKPSKKEIEEFLSRGVQEVIDQKKLAKALASGKPIRVYLGIDPTGTELHLGHAIVFHKMRTLQEWGHHVILLVGDFTAMIGDPTGKDQTRVPLNSEQILENAKDYQEQAAKLLDFDGKNPIEVKYNSHWLGKLSFADVVELSSNFTVQQMLERDMFQRRMKDGKPISMHEFMYPLMQGYDSVAMDVDLELGGSDQLFNMLAGRTLKDKLRNEEKHVMTVTILEGSDGRKMSKSYNNHIPLTADPADMYGRVMSIKDNLIIQYFWLTTEYTSKQIEKIEKDLKKGANPRDYKMELARDIVTTYHSAEDAKVAEEAFINQFQKGKLPENIKKQDLGKSTTWAPINLLQECEDENGKAAVSSRSEARRLISQGAVRLLSSDGQIVHTFKDEHDKQKIKNGYILQVGKRRYWELIV